jgi:serine phosphatase RsbU (regulator of sigma subunit)
MTDVVTMAQITTDDLLRLSIDGIVERVIQVVKEQARQGYRHASIGFSIADKHLFAHAVEQLRGIFVDASLEHVSHSSVDTILLKW